MGAVIVGAPKYIARSDAQCEQGESEFCRNGEPLLDLKVASERHPGGSPLRGSSRNDETGRSLFSHGPLGAGPVDACTVSVNSAEFVNPPDVVVSCSVTLWAVPNGALPGTTSCHCRSA